MILVIYVVILDMLSYCYCTAQFCSEVPEVWYCEICQSTDCANLTISPLQEESSVMVPSSTREIPDNFGSQANPKRQRTAKPCKVMCLSTEEVIKLSSRKNPLKSKVFTSKSPVRAKSNSHLVSSGCQHPFKSRSLMIGSSINQQREISAAKALKDGMNSISGKKDLVKQPEKHVGEEQSMDINGLLYEKDASIWAKEESMMSASPISQSRCFQPIDESGGDNDAVAESGYSFEETRFLHYILPKLEVCRPYLPALSATWSGRLKFPGDAIPNDSSYSFRAHPPCSVRRKAYELSRHMPMEIRMEPIPLTPILTNIFQSEGPDIDDIGLYFYPADTADRYIVNYSALVQLMVSQEYAMRGLVNGAELLLFTSKELLVDSHLFIVGLQSEYFLWGIFRSAKSTLDCKSLHEELDVHPPLPLVDHSNNGHSNSDKSSAIDGITGIDDLSRNSSKGGSTSREEGTIDEIALPGTDFAESFQEDAQDVVVAPVAANYTCSRLVETTCCPAFNVKGEDTGSERVDFSSGVEAPKQSNQQVKVEAREITLDEHDVVERSLKLPPKIEKPDIEVGAPELGCSLGDRVKLNTSGISRGNASSAGAGGTVHTSSGTWVLGYSLDLGKWSSLAADLWAVFQGLKLVWDRGYRQVLVVSDSSAALKCLKTAPRASDPNIDLIQGCRDLVSRDWDCTLDHISREKNAAAAWLADHRSEEVLTVLDDPPQELARILNNQDNGIPPPS
ncbi:uncharacterized protein LOC115742731 isoform X4 [Rhodamnia argentea]|uniref:Uncharacterized protein LOC115742731 isoform X4 n=1 Tax=Rhodamnia argentea TaxID=178133 RepID=A0ABM3HHE0_9MYRT|nr:uncharacterized protein LOC115742731 isoform X4 [Rhodamnia argentea]XP_048136013.1 uncharacterized protein LOC115742731 isoform X4 [Rhodamnia argentea]